MFDIEFQRSFALAFLALPILLWILARRPRPPRVREAGTLAVWREVLERSDRVPAGRGPGVPPGLYWILLALVLGSVALAGPRQRAARAPEWRVVLDTRPPMFLPWLGPQGSKVGARRIDVALEAAREWIDGEAQWLRFDGEGWELARGSDPPQDWLGASNRATDAMPWSEVDRADTLWITDRALTPRAASWVASGGAAVDGIVGRRGDRLLAVQSGELIATGESDRVTVFVESSVPHELRDLTAAWGRERGVVFAETNSNVDLRVSTTPLRTGERLVRGGAWELRGTAAEAPAGRVLWRDVSGAAALGVATGELQLACGDPLSIDGDRRALGLAWIEALESAVEPPAGSVSLAARRSAGSGGRERGAGPGPPPGTTPGALISWLALAACIAGALGMRPRDLRN